jgi:hypothetical protein
MSGRPGASAPPPNKSTPPTRLSSQPPCATHLMGWSGAAASLSLAPLLVWALDARRFQGTLRRGCRGGGAGGGRARNRRRGPRATHLIGGPGDQYRTVLCLRHVNGMALSGRPLRAGPPSPSRPAGRSRPRGPEPLYTVRRDPDGHGALAATGTLARWSRPPSLGREGTCHSGRTRLLRRAGTLRPAAPRLTRGRAGATLSGCAPTRL